MKTIPMYEKVYTDIKSSIKNGYYTAGSFLPPEKVLEKQFSTSRTTIRKAIQMLASEGFVFIKQGRGTEVLNISATQKMNGVTSFTETLKQKGLVVTTQGMCINLIDPPDHVIEALSLSPDQKVYKVERVQCANGTPISIIENYLIASMFPELTIHSNTFTSLYSFLESHYGLRIKNSIDRISAINSNFIDSQILQVPVGTALLISRRVTYTESGPFEYAFSKIIAEKYEYNIYLNGRQ